MSLGSMPITPHSRRDSRANHFVSAVEETVCTEGGNTLLQMDSGCGRRRYEVAERDKQEIPKIKQKKERISLSDK